MRHILNNIYANASHLCITYSTVYLYVWSWYTTQWPQLLLQGLVESTKQTL